MIDALTHRFQNLRTSRRPRWALMPKGNAALLAEIAFVAATILEREGVAYTIHHGCLLGATRLRGLLPWDKDIDLFILPDKGQPFDPDRFAKVCARHGLHVDVGDQGRGFTIRPALRIAGFVLPLFPMIEIDVLERSVTPQGAVVYDQSTGRRRWNAVEVEPLRRYPFHGSWLPGPGDPEPALFRLYQEASSEFALQRFHRASLPRSTDLFWRLARPPAGETDWGLVQQRASALRKTIVWRCLYGLPWYLMNSLYASLIQTLRRGSGGHVQ